MSGDLDPASSPSRRQVLTWLAGGAVGLGAAGLVGARLLDDDPSPSSGAAAKPPPPPPTHRTLVLVELGGGNDGLDTLIPFEDGRLRDARPTLTPDPADVIDLGDGWGLNRRLGPLDERGLAALAGVGSPAPDLSHFEMLDRWARGTPALGAMEAAAGGTATGFLARMADALATEDELVGASLQFGEAAIMRSEGSRTAGLGDVAANALLDPEVGAEVKARIALLASGARTGPTEAARRQLRPVGSLLDVLHALPSATPDVTYPDSALGLQLAAASRLLRAPSGLRVLHVPQTVADYDTHGRHRETHDRLFDELGVALAAFHDDLVHHGMADRVLVATISEFGRRVAEASGGLDHGTASTMLLMGPVVAGAHGERPDIGDLDDDGNLRTPTAFDRYYATLAAWLDVDPGQVLGEPGGPAPVPLDGLVRR